jgi:dTDP-glucose 4,6-dehydratase
MKLLKKNIILTGGCGFIGSNMCKLLIKKKYFVINIDCLAPPFNSIKMNHPKQNYKHYKININQTQKISFLIKKYNPVAIINFAAETHVDRSIDNNTKFYKTNLMGTVSLLNSIKKAKLKTEIKFIQISTDEVYGDFFNKNPAKETSPINPSSPYASSKASADISILSFYRTFNINFIITRCCNNYGPNQFPDKLIPKIILSCKKNFNIPIYGDGKQIREWIFVKDHCTAIYELLTNNKAKGIYNIGSEERIDNLSIVKMLLQQLRKKIYTKSKIIFVNDRPGHDKKYSINSNKIKKQTGWKNKTPFEKGIKKTIDWYLTNELMFKKNNNLLLKKRLGQIK